jgi:hypothetical protein
MLHWAEIAIEHERLASRAREEIERLHAAGGTPPLGEELHPAMVAVAASAHSLDALFAELAELVGTDTIAEWEQIRRRERWAQIAGILEFAFNVNVEPWRSRLRTLFVERRNPVVHPKAKFKPVAKHPTLQVNVSSEYVTYSIESARESVALLIEILSTCVEVPRPATEAWANDARSPIERLRGLRASG